MIDILLVLAGFLLGFAVGQFVRNHITRTTKNGTLRIDDSDPYDGPHMFLELESSVDAISRSKFVTLEVVAKNYISRQ